MPAETSSSAELASQILVIIGQDPGGGGAVQVTLEAFRRCTRDQLLDMARRLGLTGVSKLAKDALATRVASAFASLTHAAAANGTGADDIVDIVDEQVRADARQEQGHEGNEDKRDNETNDEAITFHKFDLGREVEDKPLPQNIPWGYDQDRVTAMPVDPEKLYAYWEVTDAALEVARRALGPGGTQAWMNLRVYDTTGRLFDGTNAHSYFDHQIGRDDRQWFFEIGKPTSTACVEVGLKSPEGYFVKIARSGRVDFPRRRPAGDAPVEWLTVRSSTGAAGDPFPGGAPGAEQTAPAPGGGGGALGGGAPEGWQGWTEGAGFPTPGGHRVFERRWDWQEGAHEHWEGELSRIEWVGPTLRTEWEAGPFSYPVEPPSVVESRESGEITVRTQNGLVHVVYGPWQVVIRGIGARAERRVLATWEYKRTVAVAAGQEREVVAWGRLTPGSSEWMALGASERAWLGASELLFRGASELYLLGASELRLGGASETLYAGGSEYRFRGASERLMRGASEWMHRGASERLYAGASEGIYAGASERRLGGASELSYAGASERLYAGASERRLGGGGDTTAGSTPPPFSYPET